MYCSFAFKSQSPANLIRYELRCCQNRHYCQELGGKREKTVMSNYDNQRSELEGVENDKVFQENVSPGPATKEPTIIEHDDKGV